MSSKDYWNKREAEALKHYITDEKEYDKRIKEIYEDMLDSIQSEIDGFFGRYAKFLLPKQRNVFLRLI